MRSEKAKMLAGELYDPLDPQLSAERGRARLLFKALNDSAHDAQDERARLIRDLIPPPAAACGSVLIGSGVLFGPSVHVYAATHPLNAAARRTGLELGRSVEIGDEVWIGGAAVICPGVRIGAQSVIGAGSVVTRDIPRGVFAAGNPCRVVRDVEQG